MSTGFRSVRLNSNIQITFPVVVTFFDDTGNALLQWILPPPTSCTNLDVPGTASTLILSAASSNTTSGPLNIPARGANDGIVITITSITQGPNNLVINANVQVLPPRLCPDVMPGPDPPSPKTCPKVDVIVIKKGRKKCDCHCRW
jgi:hypothetical protein